MARDRTGSKGLLYNPQNSKKMILTDYYLFKKTGGGRFKFDYIQGTKTYKPLEKLTTKKGDLLLYIGEDIYSKTRSGNLAVSNKKAITRINTEKIGGCLFGYGDWVGTEDALLFMFSKGEYKERKFTENTLCEIFIARGQKKCVKRVFFEFVRGRYNEEIINIRKHVVTPQRTLFDV